MITLGLILLVLALLLDIGIFWILGVILVVVGAIFFVLGAMGRAIGGRRHYY